MNRRLVALTARRAALQAECALQRDDMGRALAGVGAGAARVDRVIEVGRRVGPAVVVGGVLVALLLGPRRVLAATRQVITWGVYAANAYRLVR